MANLASGAPDTLTGSHGSCVCWGGGKVAKSTRITTHAPQRDAGDIACGKHSSVLSTIRFIRFFINSCQITKYKTYGDALENKQTPGITGIRLFYVPYIFRPQNHVNNKVIYHVLSRIGGPKSSF